MSSIQATARTAGLVYFVFMIVSIFAEFLFPNLVVSGDAAATARNIADGELVYRAGILLGLANHVIFIVLVAVLYRLFRDVDTTQAVLMVLFVSIGIAVALSNTIGKFAPLTMLRSADSLSAFSRPQLDALALGWLGVRRGGAAFPLAFWGLWLFPFGMLVIRSGFLPRILGVLLLVAGAGYLATATVTILWPDLNRLMTRLMTPLYLGELPIIFWLLIKGAGATPSVRPPIGG